MITWLQAQVRLHLIRGDILAPCVFVITFVQHLVTISDTIGPLYWSTFGVTYWLPVYVCNIFLWHYWSTLLVWHFDTFPHVFFLTFLWHFDSHISVCNTHCVFVITFVWHLMTFWWHFDSPIRFMRSFMQVRLAPMQISYVSIASSPPIMWKPGAHLLCTRYHVLHISFVWYLFDQISCTSHMLCLVSVWLDIMYFTCTLFDMGIWGRTCIAPRCSQRPPRKGSCSSRTWRAGCHQYICWYQNMLQCQFIF